MRKTVARLVVVCLITSIARPVVARCEDPRLPAAVDSQEIIKSGKLPRFEPLDPDEAAESFEIAEGFRIELVAAEPLVVDPVAFCFDHEGRLIVVEMRGYSERADSKTGRVRRLTDTDFDGQMDEAETLIDGLEWPTAVACWGDGIVIGVAPDILYLPLSEDGKHGPPEKLFTGFGKSNVQGLFNSFQWGPDLELHCATSSSGALVSGKTLAGEVRLGRRDFTIDYHTRELTPVNGGGQHGMSFDRWGNKFVCSNSDHLQQVLLLPPVPGRSFTFDEPPFRKSIAADGPQAPVFRSSPVEPWRILRTHLRVNGLAKGPIEGGGKAAGYFTGATGIHIYEGDQWPRDPGDGLALVCDVGSNLIHRKRLVGVNRLWFRGERIDESTEFLRSSDTWFRPVQLGGGPDGALYVADMYREVIEHPKSLPPAIKSQLDLNSGSDRGRIWRIVAEGKRPRTRVIPSFDSLETNQLLRYLSHPNLWHRRTAARLLMQREHFSGSGLARLRDKLRDLALGDGYTETRLEALSLLSRLPNGFDTRVRDEVVVDQNPWVRWRGLRLAIEHVERLGPLPSRWFTLPVFKGPYRDFMLFYGSAALVPEPIPRLNLIGQFSDRRLLNELRVLDFRSPKEEPTEWLRWAIQGSLTHDLLKTHFTSVYRLQPELTTMQTLGSREVDLVRRLVSQLDELPDDESLDSAVGLIGGITDRLRVDQATEPLRRWVVDRVMPRLGKRGLHKGILSEADSNALRLAGWALGEKANGLLEDLLGPTRSPTTQRVAIESLASDDQKFHEVLLRRIPELTPAVQQTAWATLGRQRSGLRVIASAVEKGELAPADVPVTVRETMWSSRDARVRSAIPVTGLTVAMPDSYSKYLGAVKERGNQIAGELVFRKHCAACHAPETGGNLVGPPLKSVADKKPEQILISILDPNREVDPKYYRVQVLTNRGTIFVGVLTEETETRLAIVDAQGKRHSVLRRDIESLQTVKQSLMPSNLVNEISPEQMRDLVSFLKM